MTAGSTPQSTRCAPSATKASSEPSGCAARTASPWTDSLPHPISAATKSHGSALFDAVQPDILAIQGNLLTPFHRAEGVFSFADEHNVGILISKPLGQGLLTGTYQADTRRTFGDGDHRLRKRWFQSEAIEIINAGLDRIRATVGSCTEELIRIAIWGCLNRSSNAVALVGFTHPDQVAMNLSSLSPQPGDNTQRAQPR